MLSNYLLNSYIYTHCFVLLSSLDGKFGCALVVKLKLLKIIDWMVRNGSSVSPSQSSGTITEERAERMEELEDGKESDWMWSFRRHVAEALMTSLQLWLPSLYQAIRKSRIDERGAPEAPPRLRNHVLLVATERGGSLFFGNVAHW